MEHGGFPAASLRPIASGSLVLISLWGRLLLLLLHRQGQCQPCRCPRRLGFRLPKASARACVLSGTGWLPTKHKDKVEGGHRQVGAGSEEGQHAVGVKQAWEATIQHTAPKPYTLNSALAASRHQGTLLDPAVAVVVLPPPALVLVPSSGLVPGLPLHTPIWPSACRHVWSPRLSNSSASHNAAHGSSSWQAAVSTAPDPKP